MLEGGVNEISNINTSKDFIANIDGWKKKVADDSSNLYQLAEKSLAENPQLKKVIILKRIFRCDDNVKEILSQYANSVYDDLWLKRGRPSGIYIADQKLQCDGELRVLRYGHPYYGNFDGIHMRGKLSAQHYTKSVIDVFTSVYPELLSPNTTKAKHNTTTTFRQSGN